MASAAPSSGVLTNMLVSLPPASRISNTGAARRRNPAMCETGRNGVPVTPQGSNAGAWLCTTALTSGGRLVNLSMDKALAEHFSAALIQRLAPEVELHDIVGRHHAGRARSLWPAPVSGRRTTRADLTQTRALSVAHAPFVVPLQQGLTRRSQRGLRTSLQARASAHHLCSRRPANVAYVYPSASASVHSELRSFWGSRPLSPVNGHVAAVGWRALDREPRCYT